MCVSIRLRPKVAKTIAGISVFAVTSLQKVSGLGVEQKLPGPVCKYDKGWSSLHM